ncbi:MAG: DMT family transporter [Pseudomonadota bacterium]
MLLRTRQSSGHAKGLLITISGVIVMTPDSLLVLLAGLEPLQTLVWRGYLQCLAIACLIVGLKGKASVRVFRAIGIIGLFAALSIAVSSASFLYALDNTTVANTLVILAAAPIFAAAFSSIFLKEAAETRTIVAILFVFTGIAIIGWGSLREGTLVGDLAALTTAISMAAYFTILRHAKHQMMLPVIAIGGLLAGTTGLFLGGGTFPEGKTILYLGLMGLLVMPLSSALLNIGPQYLPAATVALILLLETFLGPYWVWLVLDQVPPAITLAGGSIVVTTLIVHALLGFRSNRS